MPDGNTSQHISDDNIINNQNKKINKPCKKAFMKFRCFKFKLYIKAGGDFYFFHIKVNPKSKAQISNKFQYINKDAVPV
jgi:hypothetical protein